MPNPTQHIGQCIRYRIDPGEAQVGAGPLQPLLGPTTAANVMIGNDPRNPAAGGTAWNFNFLKYHAGEVTTCSLLGNVMTGPFTGCYAFSYITAGQPTLAHVGTAHEAGDPGTIRAKQIWQAVVVGGATNIKGEAPDKHFSSAELTQGSDANRGQRPIICSYYEPPNAWAILFFPAVAGVTVVHGALRIVAAKPMPQLDWNLVRAMREFR